MTTPSTQRSDASVPTRSSRPADLDALLAATSRTFALAIPLLPEPTRREVTIAYLLLRIGDTLEDAPWPAPRRVAALQAFRELLTGPRQVEAFLRRIGAAPGDASPACLELLEATGGVLEAFDELSPPAQEVVRRQVVLTLEGMAQIAQGAGGSLELHSLPELRHYCYLVAGLVGELLTELFLLHHAGLAKVASQLRGQAAAFGEGLQLTNILKDQDEDEAAGRRFIPKGLDRARVFELAREDLAISAAYIQALRSSGAPRGFLAFTGLPLALAVETLRGVERVGPGAKVPREQVAAILAQLQAAS